MIRKRISTRLKFLKAALAAAAKDIRLGFVMKPIAGADGSTDTQTEPNTETETSTTETQTSSAGPESTTTDSEPKIPEGKVLADQSELNRLKRIAAERDKEEKDRKRKEAEEAGRHEEVSKELEAEREAEKTRRENLERSITVRDVATRLKFTDPADALHFLPDDIANDESAIERALKKVAEEKPYLIGGQGNRTGAPGGGNDPTPPADIDDQIREAEKEGDTAKSIRLKRVKAAQNQG